MNWAVGANCYLLRAVHTHGKNWDLVRESLKTSFKTFLKNENVEDLSNQVHKLLKILAMNRVVHFNTNTLLHVRDKETLGI